MENRTGQIIELENNQEYLILRQAIYKNEYYYVVDRVVDEESNGEVKKNLAKDFLILHEMHEADGNIYMETVEDPKIAMKILEK